MIPEEKKEKKCQYCGDIPRYTYNGTGTCLSCNNALSKDSKEKIHPEFDVLKLSQLYKNRNEDEFIMSIIPPKEGGMKHHDNYIIVKKPFTPKNIEKYRENIPKKLIFKLKELFKSEESIESLENRWYHAHQLNTWAVKRAAEFNALHPDCNMRKCIEVYYQKILKGDKWQVDHILPLSKGGKHHHENLQIIPEDINFKKLDNLDFKQEGIKHWSELPDYVNNFILI